MVTMIMIMVMMMIVIVMMVMMMIVIVINEMIYNKILKKVTLRGEQVH